METNKHLACVLKAATWDFYVLFILAPPVDKKNKSSLFWCCTARLQSSFFPQAVRLLNSL